MKSKNIKPTILMKDAIELISGRDLTKSQYNDEINGIPYIMGASNIKNGEFKIERWTDSPTVIGKKGDVILSVKGTVGQYFILNEEEVHLSRQVMALRAKDGYLNQYIRYFLSFYIDKLKAKAKGMIPGITREDILYAELPNFDLEEQRTIINILKISESLCNKRKVQVAALSALTQSVFLEMFGDPISNSKNHQLLPLKELGVIQTGNTPSRKVEEYYGEYLEWIKSDNINTPSDFLTKAEEYLSEKGAEKGRVASTGSVLVTCIAGSLDCIGNAAIADRDVAFNQQINAITPNKKIDVYFLLNQFKFGKKLVQQASTNSMKGMVSKSKFEEILFILPNMEDQKKFSEIYLRIEAQKAFLEKSLLHLENNFNSLIQRAFKGELFKD